MSWEKDLGRDVTAVPEATAKAQFRRTQTAMHAMASLPKASSESCEDRVISTPRSNVAAGEICAPTNCRAVCGPSSSVAAVRIPGGHRLGDRGVEVLRRNAITRLDRQANQKSFEQGGKPCRISLAP